MSDISASKIPTHVGRACAAVLRRGAGGLEILMVQYRSYWTLPGGGINPGERPEDAALRELREETGLEGNLVRRIFDDCYLVEVPADSEPVLGCDPELPPDGQHLHAVAWFPVAGKRDGRQVRCVIQALGLEMETCDPIEGAETAWRSLDDAWQEAFRQAWEALRTGNIGVGAVLSRPDGEIVASSRNRVADTHAPPGEICASSLAHAELNVLATVPFRSRREYVLTTTLQPCLQCSAAIRMAPVAKVRIAGADPLWDGCQDFTSLAPWVARRQPVPLEGPRRDRVGVFATLLSRFGPGLIPTVEEALRGSGQARILDLARSLEQGGHLATLTRNSVEAALTTLWSELRAAVEPAS